MNHLPFIACNRTAIMMGGLLPIAILAMLFAQQPLLAQPIVSDDHITIRKTSTSVPGVPSPGHEDHQIVMALPPAGNGKIWTGKLSWISSEPIEVGFLIGHNKSAEDEGHSHLETLQVNESSNLVFASTNLTGNTPQNTFGNMDFIVDQLVFHSTNNTRFTVTYAIDAVARDVTIN
jgi:hypothetical protein